MAQNFYKLDIQETQFPMLSEQQSRTIIGSTAGEAPGRGDRPGIAYCHNVMPSKYGLDSVGYLTVVSAFLSLPAGAEFEDVRTVYGDQGSRIYLGWDTFGNVYALLDGSTDWLSLPATSPITTSSSFSSESITVGNVNGISYIFYSKTGCFTYNETTKSLDSVTLPGLSIADVLGVVGSSGYLIAYTTRAIAWSSTIDPTDFVPSDVTGAGGGNISNIAGDVLFIVPNTLGILIYTRANIVAGTYTGNAKFPFKFREVEESKGGLSLDLVTHESNGSRQFVYSKAGLQAITSRAAETLLPEVTDFLAGKRFEDFNETTNLYEFTDLSASITMKKKIKYIASRYLVISYGISEFTHALVYDTSLQKLGKLKIAHKDVFEYVDDQTEISKENIAFLTADGSVQVLDFSVTRTSSGVIILGKFQLIRTRFLQLLGIEIENVPDTSKLEVIAQVSLDGKTFTNLTGSIRNSSDNFAEYAFRATGKNHSVILKGEFNIVTAQIRYSIAGKR